MVYKEYRVDFRGYTMVEAAGEEEAEFSVLDSFDWVDGELTIDGVSFYREVEGPPVDEEEEEDD